MERPLHVSQLAADAMELGNFRHYMQKEIFEQPAAVEATLEAVSKANSLTAQVFGFSAIEIFEKIDSALILACGTSYHAGVVARYWLESLAGIPCNVEIASEYRYRDTVPNPRTLVIVISQSGETADTIAALSHARKLGQLAAQVPYARRPGDRRRLHQGLHRAALRPARPRGDARQGEEKAFPGKRD